MPNLNKLALLQSICSLLVLQASAKEATKQDNSKSDQKTKVMQECTNTPSEDLNKIEAQLNAKPLLLHTSLDQTIPANRPYARKVLAQLHADIKDAEAWFGLGCFCSSARKSKEAMLAYRNALAINPNHTMALNNLGTELMNQNQLKEAEAAYMKALSINPNGSWTNLAEVRHLLGDTKGEQAALEHARASGEAAAMASYLRFNELLKQNR